VVRIFPEFNLFASGCSTQQTFLNPTSHNLVYHVSCVKFCESPTQTCKQVQIRMNRMFVRDMMTMMKRQSVASLLGILW